MARAQFCDFLQGNQERLCLLDPGSNAVGTLRHVAEMHLQIRLRDCSNQCREIVGIILSDIEHVQEIGSGIHVANHDGKIAIPVISAPGQGTRHDKQN